MAAGEPRAAEESRASRVVLSHGCERLCGAGAVCELALCAGVKNADEAELRQVASEPLELTVYNVLDFPLLGSLVGKLTRVLCARIKERSHRETTGDVRPPGEG